MGESTVTQYPQSDTLIYSLTRCLGHELKQEKQEHTTIFLSAPMRAFKQGEASVKTAAAQALYYSANREKAV
jgi:hypothetical protein